MPEKELRKPSKKLRSILADNLLAFRNAKKISQEELAEICGLHRTYVGSVERGERNVTLSTLEVFSSVLDITVAELLTSHAQPTSDAQPRKHRTPRSKELRSIK